MRYIPDHEREALTRAVLEWARTYGTDREAALLLGIRPSELSDLHRPPESAFPMTQAKAAKLREALANVREGTTSAADASRP